MSTLVTPVASARPSTKPHGPPSLCLDRVPSRSSSLRGRAPMRRKSSLSTLHYLPSPPHTSTFAPTFDLDRIDDESDVSDSATAISDSHEDSDLDSACASECTLFREVALDEGLKSTLPFRGMPSRPESLTHAQLVQLTRDLYMDGLHLRRTVLQLSQQALYLKSQLEATHLVKPPKGHPGSQGSSIGTEGSGSKCV